MTDTGYLWVATPATVRADWRTVASGLDRAGVGALVLDDPGVAGAEPGLDPGLLASFLAPLTHGLGLVPAYRVTHLEPFHVSKAVATLDHASAWHAGPYDGRAGWLVDVDTSPAGADEVGRRPAPDPTEAWTEAAAVADTVARLWDSWEDDAIIRDRATGRFVDRDRLHYVDVSTPYFSVRGPSITPRPPQGRPVTVTRADRSNDALVARHADVVVVALGDGAGIARVRAVAAANADRTTEVVVLVEAGPDELVDGGLEAARQAGADGIVVRVADPDRAVAEVEAVTRSLRSVVSDPTAGGSLRSRLGLPRPANRYRVA